MTSPTAILIQFRDENLSVLIENQNHTEASDVVVRYDVTKLRNRSEVDGLEWQEIDVFIGNNAAVATTLKIVILSRR